MKRLILYLLAASVILSLVFTGTGYYRLRARESAMNRKIRTGVAAGMAFQDVRRRLQEDGFNLALRIHADERYGKSEGELLAGTMEAYYIDPGEVFLLVPPSVRQVELRMQFQDGRLLGWHTHIRDNGIGS